MPNNVQCGLSNPAKAEGETDMTGAELTELRRRISAAVGYELGYADMAELCGLRDPRQNGLDTMRKWEQGLRGEPSGPIGVLVELLAAGLDPTAPPEVRTFFDLYISNRLGLELINGHLDT